MPEYPSTNPRRPPERMRIPTALLFILLLPLLTACPDGADSSAGAGGPVDKCEKAGQRCRLGDGKLGVCTMKTGGGLHCMSQH